MMTEDEVREYRKRMGEAAGSIAQRSTEASREGKTEEAALLFDAALSAYRIHRGERP